MAPESSNRPAKKVTISPDVGVLPPLEPGQTVKSAYPPTVSLNALTPYPTNDSLPSSKETKHRPEPLQLMPVQNHSPTDSDTLDKQSPEEAFTRNQGPQSKPKKASNLRNSPRSPLFWIDQGFGKRKSFKCWAQSLISPEKTVFEKLGLIPTDVTQEGENGTREGTNGMQEGTNGTQEGIQTIDLPTNGDINGNSSSQAVSNPSLGSPPPESLRNNRTRRPRTYLCFNQGLDYSTFALNWLVSSIVESGDTVIWLCVAQKRARKTAEQHGVKIERTLCDNEGISKSIDFIRVSRTTTPGVALFGMIEEYLADFLIIGTQCRYLKPDNCRFGHLDSDWCRQNSRIPAIFVADPGQTPIETSDSDESGPPLSYPARDTIRHNYEPYHSHSYNASLSECVPEPVGTQSPEDLHNTQRLGSLAGIEDSKHKEAELVARSGGHDARNRVTSRPEHLIEGDEADDEAENEEAVDSTQGDGEGPSDHKGKGKENGDSWNGK